MFNIWNGRHFVEIGFLQITVKILFNINYFFKIN